MTVQTKIDSSENLTLQEIGSRSRHLLRTSGIGSGVLIDAPEIVGKIVDHLIPKTILDPGPMTVRFETNTIAEPQDNDEWELWQRKGTTGSGALIKSGDLGPVTGRPATVDIEVETNLLLDDDLTKSSTTYEYQFIVYRGDNGNPDASPWFVAEIDRNAPEQDKLTGNKFKPERAAYTNLPDRGTINEEWLENNTSLEIDVQVGYEFHRRDDAIDVYISSNYGMGTPVHTQPLPTSTVSIPRVNLPELDGLYYLWYVLRDVVGNESEPAITNTFNVTRRPPPVLIPCRIPKGELPDVIDLEDLESPVFVEVSYTTNGQPTDRILPSIGTAEFPISLGSQTLGAPGTTLQFPVAINRLLALWGSSTAELPIAARYNLERGLEPARPSVETPSALDFTYRGPVNPVFPERQNPNMTVVTVVGDSGTLNHITSADRGIDATMRTPYVTAPVTWIALGDETVRLWFNGKDVHNFTISAGAVTPLSFTLPFAEIDAAGVGKKIAYWTVEETGGRNVMRSPDTEVTIDPVRVVLPAPTVRLFNGFVSCRYLTRPDFELPVTVPIDSTFMPTGTVVTLRSHGTTDEAGLTLIPGTEFSDTYTINGSETGGVFIKNIQPYLTKLKPIQPPASTGMPNGYIKIWYEVPMGSTPNPSLEFLNEVSLLNASQNYCEGTPTS